MDMGVREASRKNKELSGGVRKRGSLLGKGDREMEPASASSMMSSLLVFCVSMHDRSVCEF